MKKNLFTLSFLFFVLISSVSAQTQTNLEVIYKLIDHSVAKADSLIGRKRTIYLSVTSPQPLEVLKAKILQTFNDHGYVLKSAVGENDISVNYTITSAKVEYKNSFTDGIFSGALIERETSLNSSLTVMNTNRTIQPYEFIESKTDTVKLNEIASLETQTLPFTQAQIPSQPLLSNFWEPIIVIGTLIVTVILLFTVRSK